MDSQRSAVIVSALLFVVLGLVAAVALRRHAPEPEPAREPPPVAAAPAPAPAPPAPEAAPPAPAPEPPAHPATVKLQVQTTPAGAEARFDDRPLGRTPLEAQVDYDTQPHKLSLRRPGTENAEQSVVPDHDQLVAVPLQRRKNVHLPRH